MTLHLPQHVPGENKGKKRDIEAKASKHASKRVRACDRRCVCGCARARGCASVRARARAHARGLMAALPGGVSGAPPRMGANSAAMRTAWPNKVETRGRVPGVGRIVKWRKLEADSYNLVKLEHPKRLGEAVKGRPLQIPIQPPRLTEPAQCQRTEPHGVARPPFSVAALSLPCTGRAAGTPPPTNNGGLALCIC